MPEMKTPLIERQIPGASQLKQEHLRGAVPSPDSQKRIYGPIEPTERRHPVDREQLRATQAPLKARYREDPTTALVTLRAAGRLGDEDVSCSVDTGRAMVEAGLHPATGGYSDLACSGDMLLQALVACAGVTMRSVATNRGLKVEGNVRAEGDLDFRGTLGVDRDAPVGFTAIRLSFDLSAPTSADEIADLIATTERYCVVLQTLAGTPIIKIDASAASA